jgi:hypothetical protein
MTRSLATVSGRRVKPAVPKLPATNQPDGQITSWIKILSSPSRKNIPVCDRRKSVAYRRHPARSEGRIAIVTKRWAGCGGRYGVVARLCARTNGVEAYGEVVWF